MMHWEIQQGADVSGPFSEDEILMMVETGRIDGDTLVRPEGKQAWKPATRHGRFAEALRAVAEASDAAAPAAARSRRAPIDGVPFKDPARWDQQTQLGLPVATLLPGGVPAAPAEPGASGAGAANGAGPTREATSGGPPPLPATNGGAAAQAPAVTAASPVAPTSAVASGSSAAPTSALAPAYAAAPATAAAARSPATAPRAEGGLLSGLFDLGFTTFITGRLARILYTLHVVAVLAAFVVSCVVGVGTLQAALRIDSQGMLLAAVAQLVATPIVCLIALVIGRVVAESVVVFFHVAEHLAAIDRKTPG